MPPKLFAKSRIMFQHTAARRRLAQSRFIFFFIHCFNTQPPEGGWGISPDTAWASYRFNTQPPEGGWNRCFIVRLCKSLFQHTAARRRLGRNKRIRLSTSLVSTHSRPKAAGSQASS